MDERSVDATQAVTLQEAHAEAPAEAGQVPRTGRGGTIPPVETRFGGPRGNPQNPAGSASRRFSRKMREFFSTPETEKLLYAKIKRDLEGDGAATFATRCLAYAYGEPKQTIEIEGRERARKIAEELGVPMELVIERASRIADSVGIGDAEPS